MMRVSWFHPRTERKIESEAVSANDLLRVVDEAWQVTAGCGLPSVVAVRNDDTVLAVSGDGERAFITWVDSLGDSYHSVGGSFTEILVFDHFGSWSEALGERRTALPLVAWRI
jgi:hypothetical protein